MISVPSLPQQLSGNSILYAVLGLVILCSGCKSTKRATTSSSSQDNTRTTRTNTNDNPIPSNSKVKVIDWTIIDPKEEAPIGAPTVIEAQQLEDYHVSLLIPFNGNETNSGELASKSSGAYRFISYYAGVKMAGEDNSINSSVQVNVYDSESQDINDILNSSSVKNSDVIVGPYDSKQLQAVAKFANDQKITHVSPWKSSSSIAKENPYHVQTKPSLTQHYRVMVENAVKTYPEKDIYVLGKKSSSDQKRMAYIKKLGSSMGRPDIKEYTVDEDSLRTGETAFDSIFVQNQTSVVLIPNWSSNDEGFIYGCVRKLRVEKDQANLVVYGMPKMMDTNKITYDFYNNLNIHIVRSDYIDPSTDSAQELRKRYFDQYNAFPTDDLYEGYDMMSFVLNNLDEHGKNFQMKLGLDRNKYLQTKYDIIPVPNEGVETIKGPDDIKYYENDALTILQFMNGKFIKK